MGILTLLDTEYLEEFDYGHSELKSQYVSVEEGEKVYIAKPNDRYTYRSMLEVLFPD